MLLPPDVTADKEFLPIAVFPLPVTAASKALSPRTVLLETEFAPLPTVTPFMVASADICTLPAEVTVKRSVIPPVAK